jgi:hypothetical protein
MNQIRYKIPVLIFLGLSFWGTGCQLLKNSPKYNFSEGYYTSRLYHKKLKKVYIVPYDDSIKIYSAKRLGIKGTIDTATALKLAFPANKRPIAFEHYSFRQQSLDLDVLNLLFKYRPPVKGFPPQFNNNILNAALYLGHRSDIYRLSYKRSPLGIDHRTITHYGYSFGIFTGLGASRIDEYVTRGALDIEYDGIVHLAGAAAIIAIDRINFGVNLGIDHLLDRNGKVWIYQGKPWLGMSIGLNLN